MYSKAFQFHCQIQDNVVRPVIGDLFILVVGCVMLPFYGYPFLWRFLPVFCLWLHCPGEVQWVRYSAGFTTKHLRRPGDQNGYDRRCLLKIGGWLQRNQAQRRDGARQIKNLLQTEEIFFRENYNIYLFVILFASIWTSAGTNFPLLFGCLRNPVFRWCQSIID